MDLSQAFDRVNRAKLDRALLEHHVDDNLRSTITAIHEDAAYRVSDRYHSTDVRTTQGIRQGCRLAPALWSILSSQVLWDLTPAESTPMQLPWTLCADDHLGHWQLQTIADVHQMEAAIRALFTTLESYGLKVNPEKSHMIIQVKGTQLKKLVKSRTVHIKNQPHWRLQSGEQQHLIPLCESITYLGTKISLKEGSDATLDFRLAEAAAKTSSLKKSIRSRKGLSRFHRVRVWRTCVVSSSMYGLLNVQFNGHMVAKLRAWFHRHLRATVHMPAHLTKVSNSDLRAQYDLPDPIAVLEQRLDQKIQQLQQNQGDPAIQGPGVLEYWNQLLTQLRQAASTPSSTVLMEAPASTQHACPTCGLYYPTRKALRQHQALRHGQIQADKLDIEYRPQQHSVAGMPQCKHCLLKLYHWQSLKGHIMQNVCNWYQPSTPEGTDAAQRADTQRTRAETDNETYPPTTNNDGERPQPGPPEERLSASGEDAAKPLLQQSAVLQHLHTHDGVITQADLRSNHLQQHCGFCQRWIAESGMIKTHILRIHKDLAPLLNAELHAACTKFKHRLKRDQPCRWCGKTVHGTDRHCSQCPVLFQLILAQVRRQAASATPNTALPSTWPMPQPVMRASIAECLANPDAVSGYSCLKNMATVAKTHCLQHGEPVQDIQAWRRHTKASHREQGQLLDAMGSSNTLLIVCQSHETVSMVRCSLSKVSQGA